MIKNFIHITIVFSVFLSSTGFWINNHYCKGEFVKSSFFFCLGSCCEEEESDICDAERKSCSDEDHEEKEGCCHNEPDFYKLDQDQQLQKVEFKTFDRSIVLNAIVLVINIQPHSFDNRTLHYLNYSPPLIVYDRQVRLQTFLC